MGEKPPSLTIIANPISGGGRAQKSLPLLHEALEKRGFKVHQFLTQGKGDAEQESCRTRSSRILVLGGDGTINEVINGLKGRTIPFTVFPTGTANLLAREFSLPSRVEKTAAMIEEDCTLPLDVCSIGSRRFLMVAGVGFDAQITRRMKSARTGTISMLSYAGPIFNALLHYRAPALDVLIDSSLCCSDASAVVIGNLRNYGGIFSITNRADPSDGLLDICVFKGKRRLSLLKYGVAALLKRVPALKDVDYYQGESVEVLSEGPVPVQLDGDFYGTTPFRCKIHPGEVTLIVPSAWKGARRPSGG